MVLANRHDTRGRRCGWCKRTDAETLWSACVQECARCARQKQRHTCERCGGPSYRDERGCFYFWYHELLAGELCTDYLAPR